MNMTSSAEATPDERPEPHSPEQDIVRIHDRRDEIICRLELAWDRARSELFGELRAA